MKINLNNTSNLSKVPYFIGVLYVILVLVLDLLISTSSKKLVDFSLFKLSFQDITPPSLVAKHPIFFNIMSHFDIVKFLLWLIIPSIIFRKQINLKWFTISGLKKSDFLFLSIFTFVCISSLITIFIFPSLANYYSGLGSLPTNIKKIFIAQQIFWLISWLPGWEFLNRHILLRSSKEIWSKGGWFLVPITETLYHLVKPLPEAVGMFIFSLIASFYTVKRENNIPAFICHLIIELCLIVILIFS